MWIASAQKDFILAMLANIERTAQELRERVERDGEDSPREVRNGIQGNIDTMRNNLSGIEAQIKHRPGCTAQVSCEDGLGIECSTDKCRCQSNN